jgi:signal transduction histidine kinase
MARRLLALGSHLTILYGLLILVSLYLTSLYSYLLFHGLVELFIVVVASGTFMIAWNARWFLDNTYLLFLGVAYLFVAFLELLHTLAYKGMGVFGGFGTNLPTQLWVAARYLESLSLLAAPLFLGKRLDARRVFAVYLAIVALVLASIFYWKIFPGCYVEGVGLTTFKKISEYVISSMLLVAAILIVVKRRFFDSSVLRLLVASIALNGASEVTFTLYIGVYDIPNMLGHFLKLLSFFLIYKAIIETSLVKPYNLLFRNLKQSEESLRERTLELQVHNQDLDAFAHTVAHDLKNPLGLAIGYAELLADDDAALSDQERQLYAGNVVHSGRKMSEIIDELLLLAEVRQTEVEKEPLDMSAVVAQATRRLAHDIEACQAEIVLPVCWPVALGHGPWVEEVWVNYLSNALKYGGRPPRLELGGSVQADDMVRFWVRDNGAGLSPEDQARLFAPFTQIGQAHKTGHGLGLSIVRRIVEKLGGQVGVESEGLPGHGTVFSFTLPEVDDLELTQSEQGIGIPSTPGS